MALYPQQTIHYKTFVKTALVMGLRNAFASHPDTNLRDIKVTVEYPVDEVHYPALVVKFVERELQTVGIAHEELIDEVRYGHWWYKGAIELGIHAFDTRTVDYISNSIVQIISFGYLESWTNQFFTQLYNQTSAENPDVTYNSLTVNADQIHPLGEGREPAPWGAEDAFVYKGGYTVDVMGEYYSVPLSPEADTIIQQVDVYPYNSASAEDVPTGVDDPAPWIRF